MEKECYTVTSKKGKEFKRQAVHGKLRERILEMIIVFKCNTKLWLVLFIYLFLQGYQHSPLPHSCTHHGPKWQPRGLSPPSSPPVPSSLPWRGWRIKRAPVYGSHHGSTDGSRGDHESGLRTSSHQSWRAEGKGDNKAQREIGGVGWGVGVGVGGGEQIIGVTKLEKM